MTKLDYKVLRNLVENLSKQEYKDNINLFDEEIDINKVKEFIRYVILRKLSNKDLETLEKRTTVIDNMDMGFIGVYSKDNNTNVKVVLPELLTLKSALIHIHELTHYIYFIFREGIETKANILDEVVPFSNEHYFLRRFYSKQYLNDLNLQLKNSAIRCAHLLNEKDDQTISNLAHIYSYHLCKNFSFFEDDKDLLNDINESNKDLNKEFKNKGLILTSGILLKLN